MTVSQLCVHLTQEELVSWVAFFELKAEEEEKMRKQSHYARGAQAMRQR